MHFPLSRPLPRSQRFLPASAALLVSIALISPCRAGPEFTAFSGVSAPVSGQSADNRPLPSSASMQTFGALVSSKPASQPPGRSPGSSVNLISGDLSAGDLSAGAARSMPTASQAPRTPR
jgi:hypothetical protein